VRWTILSALAMLSSYLGVVSIPCAAQQSSSIRITVVDDQGAVVPGAEVRVVSLPDLVGLPAPNGTVSFKSVAPGTYQISATYPGFRDETVSDVVVVEGKTTEVNIKLKQAPPKASDFRIQETLGDVHLYSKPLTEIGQPLLCSQPVPAGKEWYRFIWVPTFEHPAFLRVDVDSDGEGILLTYVWSGEGGYAWGKSVKKARKLTSDEEWNLFETLTDIGFWTLPSKVERPPNVVILDGTEWLIEGVKDGKCHVVTRYSSPLTELFETQFLARVAKLKPYYKPDR
jgi:hypothetical protein